MDDPESCVVVLYSLIPGWMGVSIYIDQERRGHQMGSLLCLLIQHKPIGITNQRPVICVEEHLVWQLWKPGEGLFKKEKKKKLSGSSLSL